MSYNIVLKILGDSLSQGLQFVDLLQTSVSKGNASATQLPLVTEALSAACMIAKLSVCDVETSSTSHEELYACTTVHQSYIR